MKGTKMGENLLKERRTNRQASPKKSPEKLLGVFRRGIRQGKKTRMYEKKGTWWRGKRRDEFVQGTRRDARARGKDDGPGESSIKEKEINLRIKNMTRERTQRRSCQPTQNGPTL